MEYFISVGPLPPTDSNEIDDWYYSYGPFASVTEAQDYVSINPITAQYTIDEHSLNTDGAISIREITQ